MYLAYIMPVLMRALHCISYSTYEYNNRYTYKYIVRIVHDYQHNTRIIIVYLSTYGLYPKNRIKGTRINIIITIVSTR